MSLRRIYSNEMTKVLQTVMLEKGVTTLEQGGACTLPLISNMKSHYPLASKSLDSSLVM